MVAPPEGAADGRSVVFLLIRSLRPEQWTKNLIVFAGLIFGRELFDSSSLVRALSAFAVFCVLSGVVYTVNDIMDREADRRHPLKVLRPIASGALSPRLAGTVAAILAAAALIGSFVLGFWFGAVALAYLVLQALYSGPLKHIVILDVLTIAIGFVLRAVAGAVAINVAISHWLLIVTILGALFLALSKRRHELVMLADGCEAIVRAKHPNAVEETDALLLKVISERIADHQLDDTQLTLHELELIRQSFLDTLRGAYHPRIEYPELTRPGARQEALPAERLHETPPPVKVKSENA